MPTDDFNPYAPPTHVTTAQVADQHFAGEGYRIEKNVMILSSPFVLPEVCFLTGARHTLKQIEINLKVMPKWWNYVMPIALVSMQAMAVIGSMAIQKLKLSLPAGIAPPMVGAAVGFVFPALTVTGFLLFAKKVCVIGFWDESSSVFPRRRRLMTNILLFDGLLLVLSAAARLLLISGSYFTITLLISLPIALVFTLGFWIRSRRPWSRIGALERADGSLALYGLHPSFLAVCRLGIDESPRLPDSTGSV